MVNLKTTHPTLAIGVFKALLCRNSFSGRWWFLCRLWIQLKKWLLYHRYRNHVFILAKRRQHPVLVCARLAVLHISGTQRSVHFPKTLGVPGFHFKSTSVHLGVQDNIGKSQGKKFHSVHLTHLFELMNHQPPVLATRRNLGTTHILKIKLYIQHM